MQRFAIIAGFAPRPDGCTGSKEPQMMHIPSPIPSTSAAVACVLLAMFACVPQGAAQAPAASASDPILVENSKVQIRKSDYELELLRLPPDIRPGFANSERRVNDLLRRMLTDATLAAEAREAKIDQEPENARKIASEVARLHAQLRVLKVEAEAGAAFDAKRSTYESRVRELYTVDRKKYATPEQFFASHILF